jgi:hypothetical protein
MAGKKKSAAKKPAKRAAAPAKARAKAKPSGGSAKPAKAAARGASSEVVYSDVLHELRTSLVSRLIR